MKVDERILIICQWGSRVYGTHKPTSDFDFLIVATKTYPSATPNPVVNKQTQYTERWAYEIYDDRLVNATFVLASTFREKVGFKKPNQ